MGHCFTNTGKTLNFTNTNLRPKHCLTVVLTVNDLINVRGVFNFRGSRGGGGRLIDMRRLLERDVYFNLTETLTSL